MITIERYISTNSPYPYIRFDPNVLTMERLLQIRAVAISIPKMWTIERYINTNLPYPYWRFEPLPYLYRRFDPNERVDYRMVYQYYKFSVSILNIRAKFVKYKAVYQHNFAVSIPKSYYITTFVYFMYWCVVVSSYYRVCLTVSIHPSLYFGVPDQIRHSHNKDPFRACY